MTQSKNQNLSSRLVSEKLPLEEIFELANQIADFAFPDATYQAFAVALAS